MRLQHLHDDPWPGIAVHSRDGRRLIAHFTYPQLDALIRAGQLSVADLLARGPRAEQQLCRQLALLACARACRQGMTCLATDCPHHPASAVSTIARSAVTPGTG